MRELSLSEKDVIRSFESNPVIREFLEDIEREQTERAVYADLKDDELRRAALGEVRAIRSLRQRLSAAVTFQGKSGKGDVA